MNKKSFIAVCIGLIFLFNTAITAQVSKLIPQPANYSEGTGEFVFSNSVSISYPDIESDLLSNLINNFTADFKTATGIELISSANKPNATINLHLDNNMEQEEYQLDIKSSSIDITAAQADGFYYAFHTIKQLLPANVMAVMPDESITSWKINSATIKDKPRFPWRGFMLDVGRHFFDKDEVKRVIDIMAAYKMNRFHWHLTEDQGWRVEIKKYPKLTSVGSYRKGQQTWWEGGNPYYDYTPYGPYFYTQDEIREVVAYAKERFIEVIPEVDMPGHFQAALAAYPEYSCTPNAVHEVWTSYGVSGDVLNVGNPEAIQFVKDILDELIELFPFNYFHIGGDECPTGAWENNAECQALLQSLGSNNYRDLQTHFFKEIESYLKNKENPADKKKIIAWNETLGGDLTGSNVTIMSWTDWYNASKVATSKGLDVIMTPQIPYYINRRQSADSGEPYSQGSGTETLESVYAFEPIPNGVSSTQEALYKGVQGNFWTEHVFENDVLEYLMLPRLAAIAETGWSPKSKKNFNNFVSRVRQDTVLYNLHNWKYGKHYMKDKELELPSVSTSSETHWFRIISGATDDVRKDKCIEVLAAGSPLIAGNSTAKVNRLWQSEQVEAGAVNFDNQWWSLYESPTKAGRFALVNKAMPNGSVIITATAGNNTGRWDYDPYNRHYGFVLGETTMGKDENVYFSIRSENHIGQYMNFAAAGQQFSINLWADPLDGASGVFYFIPFLHNELNSLRATLLEMQYYSQLPVYTATSNRNPGNYDADKMQEMIEAIVPLESIYALSNSEEIDALQNKLTAKLNAVKESVLFPEEGETYHIYSTQYLNASIYVDANGFPQCDVVESDNEWEIKNVIKGKTVIQAQIYNKDIDKYIGISNPLELTSGPSSYRFTFIEEHQDFQISGESTPIKTPIFPIPPASLESPKRLMRDGVRAQGTGWMLVNIKNDLNTSIDHVATKKLHTYSLDGRILFSENIDKSKVSLFDISGKKHFYKENKQYKSGVYFVHTGGETLKVLVD